MTIFARILAMALAAFLLPGSAEAQAEARPGHWWGLLEVAPGQKLTLVVHIAAGADGKSGGTLDSPDQNVMGLKLVDLSLTETRLAFRLDSPAASFEARWDPGAKAWQGEWHQAGQSWPLRLSAGLPSPGLAAVWSLPKESEVAAMVDARLADRPGAGMVVGLLDPAGGRIVARGPSGGAAFDGRTIFEIGSLTKIFTALILADMVAKHEVSLDDPAEKYLPAGAKMPERGGRKITLGDLATHRSGLPRLPDNMPFAKPQDPYSDYTEALLLDFLARYTLPRDIDSRFEYSNLGFGLLGYLLSRAAHQDYPTLLQKRITGPLGLGDTVIALSADQQARFATGRDEKMRPTAPWTLPVLAGAGAVRSTGADLIAFLRAAIDPASPIGPAMRLATGYRRATGAGSQIGLAWIISPRPGGEILFHDGGTGGFRTAMALDPAKGRGVVVLTNSAAEPATDDLALHFLVGTPVQATAPGTAAK